MCTRSFEGNILDHLSAFTLMHPYFWLLGRKGNASGRKINMTFLCSCYTFSIYTLQGHMLNLNHNVRALTSTQQIGLFLKWLFVLQVPGGFLPKLSINW